VLGDKTIVKGIRLTDYQLEKLNEKAKERGITDTEYVRALIDCAIDGKIDIDIDLRKLREIALKKGITTQRLIDLVVELVSRDQKR